MAATDAMADHRIVSLILRLLSDMKYKERRQRGPDQPVEFLEFRPTLVPSVLVNKLWAEEGTSILWRRYPHLPALREMNLERRQWYANKIERLYVLGPPLEDGEDLTYLEGLTWPRLKNLELEVDWRTHGKSLGSLLHPGISHLEFSGSQTGDAKYIAEVVLPALLRPCQHLHSIHFGPDAIGSQHPVHNQVLSDLLDSVPSITAIRIKNTYFFGKDLLFARLSNRPGLEVLEIDLDPGLQLHSLFASPTAPSSSFTSLKRLHVMCYPEIALALPAHLRLIEEVQFDVARIPNQPPQDSDISILDDLLSALSQCPKLHVLKVNVGQLASHLPSSSSFPLLSGATLVKLATSCCRLQDLNLIASEPAAIDGSRISSAHFEEFCKQAPLLKKLSLKTHPSTVIALESTALLSLGMHCSRLEMLRLKIALHLPTVAVLGHVSHGYDESVAAISSGSSIRIADPQVITGNGQSGMANTPRQTISDPGASMTRPRFPHLTHLGLSRPRSPLSTISDAYVSSSTSQFGPMGDLSLEEGLVLPWAQCLVAGFPCLEILEAWGDSTGNDNESLNYFLPLEEPLASTWEFLSGVEQDLWEDDVDELEGSIEDWDADYEVDTTFDNYGGGEDWKRASLINEYPTEAVTIDGGYSEVYEEEPEGMVTPGRTLDKQGEGFFQDIDCTHTGASFAGTKANDGSEQIPISNSRVAIQ